MSFRHNKQLAKLQQILAPAVPLTAEIIRNLRSEQRRKETDNQLKIVNMQVEQLATACQAFEDVRRLSNLQGSLFDDEEGPQGSVGS